MSVSTAFAAYNAGDVAGAVEILEADLEVAKSEDPERSAILLSHLSKYLYLLGRSRDARTHLKRADALTAGTHNEARATALEAKAWLLVNDLELDMAAITAREANALATRLGLPKIAAQTLGQIATVEVGRGTLGSGLELAEQALAAARALPDVGLVAEIHINVAAALEARGRLDGCLAFLERGCREVDASHDVFHAATFLKLYYAWMTARAGNIDAGARVLGRINPERLFGPMDVFYRIARAEVAVLGGNPSAAMVWIDDIDTSGWSYTDQWNKELERLLGIIREGLEATAGA